MYGFGTGLVSPVCSSSGFHEVLWLHRWKAFHLNIVGAQYLMNGCIYWEDEVQASSISLTDRILNSQESGSHLPKGISFVSFFFFLPFRSARNTGVVRFWSPSASCGSRLVSSQRRVVSPRRSTKSCLCPLQPLSMGLGSAESKKVLFVSVNWQKFGITDLKKTFLTVSKEIRIFCLSFRIKILIFKNQAC